MARIEEDDRDVAYRKLVGLLLGALSIFIFLALVSYSHSDPGFSSSVHVRTITNWMGRLGAYTADGLFILLGITAFVIPVFLMEYAYRYFVGTGRPGWVKLGSTFIIFFVCLAFVGMCFNEVKILGFSGECGGLVGTIIGKGLSAYLNTLGSLILLVTLFIAALMLGYDLRKVYNRMIGLISGGIRPASQVALPRLSRNGEHKDRKEAVVKQSKISPSISISTKGISKKGTHHTEEIPRQATLDFMGHYNLPPLSLLKAPDSHKKSISPKEFRANAALIISKLRDFGVEGDILEIKSGPVVSMYEFKPAPGIKINRIVALADDLAMALKAAPVRVVAPIPGKNVVGIEVPNRNREIVYLRSILSSKEFMSSPSSLTIALGADIEGIPVMADLAKMPHLLIAGATGTGKSVGLNTMVLSLLYRCNPSEVKFIIIDPKRIEFSNYEGIPHLLYPVVIDPKEALPVLKWAVEEMEMRYGLIKILGVKNVDSYNRKIKKTIKDAHTILASTRKDEDNLGLLPKLVIVIDEMADLMMVNREVEEHIARLAQMARAAGIYMIVATQRPSVDVITGLIKANFPARISFRVSSRTDSRTILDASGAEQLLGMGDMLFLYPGKSHLKRIHGAYVSEEEIERVLAFIKEQESPEYVDEIREEVNRIASRSSNGAGPEMEEYDPKYDEALEFVTNKGTASISMIQRQFRIGYNRAARIIEQMERDGVIGPPDAAGKPRKVLLAPYTKDMDE